MNPHKYNKAILEIKKATRLFDAEKSVLVVKLSKYADDNPPIDLKWPIFLYRREFAFVLATLFLLILGGGGSLAVAEQSLPGDFLYPIKLSVTEPIRGIATGSVGRASFYAWTTGRRLAEAETLALDGRLSGSAHEEVRSLLEKSTASFATLEKELDQQGSLKEAAEARSEFDAEVGAHRRIIKNVKDRTNDQDGNSQIDAIEQMIKTTISPSASEKKSKNNFVLSPTPFSAMPTSTNEFSETTTSPDASPVKKSKKEVEILIEKTRQDIEKKYDKASDLQKDILDDARSTLDSAENSLKDSRERMGDESTDSVDTDESIKASLQSLREANISVKQSSRLKEGSRSRGDRGE